MKRCCHCHKLLPVSEFYKNRSHRDGLSVCCKICTKIIQKKSIERIKALNEPNFEPIIGGYKISILNHASRTENKFTIVGTDGNYYATNDKGEFLDYLRGIL